MLINASYLNEADLESYIAAVEGGLREGGSSRVTDGHQFGGSLGVSGLGINAGKDRHVEDTLNIADHRYSRLQRLIEAGRTKPDALAWNEIVDATADMTDIGVGAMLDWECDVYVPESVAVLANPDQLVNAAEMMKSMRPVADMFGLDTSDMPDMGQLETVTGTLQQMKVPLVVVGDDADTEWKIVGSLDSRWVAQSASFDDRARVIAKVKRRVGEGRWYPLISLPGMNRLGSREDRRRMERRGPGDEDKDQFVAGPLLVVEYLAIYS